MVNQVLHPPGTQRPSGASPRLGHNPDDYRGLRALQLQLQPGRRATARGTRVLIDDRTLSIE